MDGDTATVTPPLAAISRPRTALRSGHEQVVDLRVDSLTHSFDGRQRVLSDISFDIPRGQAVALIGANGAGKSTLLRCCMGLIRPTSGAVRVLGEEVASLSKSTLRRLRARVGFVFQRHNLVPRLSAFSNVIHGAQGRLSGPRVWYQSLAAREVREEAMHRLDQVGLAAFAARRVDRLSGGQSQRVAIARALMQRASMIFADEPVASLDPVAGEEVMRLFLDLMRREGLTLLFTSHNLESAVGHSERVLGLRAGRLELDQPAARSDVAGLKALYE